MSTPTTLETPAAPGPVRRVLKVHALIDSLTCGGAEVTLTELARVAPGAAIDLSVGYLHELGDGAIVARLRRLGIEPEPMRLRRMLSPRSLRATRAHLARRAPDVVHTHLGHSDLLGGLAARSLGIPVVSTLHAEGLPPGRRERLKGRLIAGARRAHGGAVIAVSGSARRAYLRCSGIDPARVTVVTNGIGDLRRPGTGRAVRRELGIPASSPLIVMTAPLRLEKGHRRAFEALDELGGSFEGLRLVVAGDGPDRREIERDAGRRGRSVLMVGHRDDVPALLDAADLILHTPVTDALPTNLIEAAAAGVPAVATAVGGVGEIVEDGITGRLLPANASPLRVAAAIARLLIRPGERAILSVGARARFEDRFRAEPWAERLRAVYESVIPKD